MISILIITSNSFRHKFFVNRLVEEFNVVGVVSEAKKKEVVSKISDEDEVIRNHFLENLEVEKKYFGKNNEFNLSKNLILNIENGQSNDDFVFEWVKDKNPDYVILYGSSIIKDPILSFYDHKIINIHLGLSPYYRGSGTNFWPLCFNEPECIGATIHLAILQVDAGAILSQVRPEDILESDTSHDIGCKTIISGTKKMIESINKYHSGLIKPVDQKKEGKIFRWKDFNRDAVLKMQENFKQGMLFNYLADKKARDAKYPIVEI